MRTIPLSAASSGFPILRMKPLRAGLKALSDHRVRAAAVGAVGSKLSALVPA